MPYGNIPDCAALHPGYRSLQTIASGSGTEGFPPSDEPGVRLRAEKMSCTSPSFPSPRMIRPLMSGVRQIGVARKPVMVVMQPFPEGEDRGLQLVGGGRYHQYGQRHPS